jgi:hypothetical protein
VTGPAAGPPPPDPKTFAEFSKRAVVALDGLWFMNVAAALGQEKALEMDVRVITSFFKFCTRAYKKLFGVDGSTDEGKLALLRAMSDLVGHRSEFVVEGDRAVMRIRACAFFEAIRQAGRSDVHDCRVLCRALAGPWFSEIDPRSGGKGEVELLLPEGGDRCDWRVPRGVEV